MTFTEKTMKEFDERFVDWGDEEAQKEVKSFLKQALEQQRAEIQAEEQEIAEQVIESHIMSKRDEIVAETKKEILSKLPKEIKIVKFEDSLNYAMAKELGSAIAMTVQKEHWSSNNKENFIFNDVLAQVKDIICNSK